MVHISRISFHNFGMGGGHGTATAGACINILGNYVYIDDIYIDQCFDGVVWEGGQDLHINHSDIRATDYPISASSAVNLWLGGLEIFPTGSPGASTGIYLNGVGGILMNDIDVAGGRQSIVITGSSQLFAKGVTADVPTGGPAWSITSSTDLECDLCWAAGAGVTTGAAGSYGVELTNVSGFRWAGGYIRENYLSGVHIGSGNRDIAFTHTHFSANGHNNPAGGYGIFINDPVNGSLKITDNLFGAVGEDAGNLSQTVAVWFNVAGTISGLPPTAPGLALLGNSVNNGTLVNTYTSPAVIVGNDTDVKWFTGGSPGFACSTGWFFSSSTDPGRLCNGGSWTSITTVQQSTPASSATACSVGQSWVDTSYAYFCVAPNTVMRALLSTF